MNLFWILPQSFVYMELLGSCYFTEHPFLTKIAIFLMIQVVQLLMVDRGNS